MQTCEEFKPNLITSLEDIKDRYSFINEVYFVREILYQVLDKKEQKIVLLNLYAKQADVEVGCALQNLEHKTDALFKIFNIGKTETKIYWSDRENKFKEQPISQSPEKKFMYVIATPIYEPATIFFTGRVYTQEKNFGNLDRHAIFFELCVALKVIHDAGYYYNNFGLNAVMLTKVDYTRIYTINNVKYKIAQEWMPVFVQFNLSNKIGHTQNDDMMMEKDFYRLFDDFLLNHDKNYSNKEVDLAWLRENILSTPIFDRFINPEVNPGEKFKLYAPMNIHLYPVDQMTQNKVNAMAFSRYLNLALELGQNPDKKWIASKLL